MTTLYVTRGEDGKLTGLDEKGARAWLKLVKLLSALAVGELLWISFRVARSPAHHRYFFAKMTALFNSQEQVSDFDLFLDWLKVGAGFVLWMPGNEGQRWPFPKSIKWEAADEQVFIEAHRAMEDFLWTPYAQATLWPHITPEQRYQCVDEWHLAFAHTKPTAKGKK